MSYLGLERLINMFVSEKLDPYIVDWYHCGLNKDFSVVVQDVLLALKQRINGTHKTSNYQQAIVAPADIIDYLIIINQKFPLQISLVKEENTDNHLYILTKAIDDKQIIHPPYQEDGIMPWNKYFSQLAAGEELHLSFDAPSAQAVIRNIL